MPRPASGPMKAMAKMGLRRDIDLALHLPLRYEDETRITALRDVRPGQPYQIEGVVQDVRVDMRPRRQLVVRLADDTGGRIALRFLHFAGGQARQYNAGQLLRARGEVRVGYAGLEIVHPVVRKVEAGAPLATALTPVYPSTAQLPQAYLRKAIDSALQRAPLDELIPPRWLPPGVPTLRSALMLLHHPSPDLSAAALEDRGHPAWQRLKYEELLAQQLSQCAARNERAAHRAPALRPSAQALQQALLAALPFQLTPAQLRVVEEIAADLCGADAADLRDAGRVKPMHRLLQGDVGAGKTVVAALAACIAIDAGWQCALMAPTEILAEQHFGKLVSWLTPLGVDVAWLTGSRKGRARQQMLDRIASGSAGLVVGTHAVIQDDVQFARLGLAIVDEQHRFGVQQRLALRGKLDTSASAPADATETGSTLEPHLLMMTATPIPRTLAMTYYADLDVSTIDELPPGRQPVLTKLIADNRRNEVIARVAGQLQQGRQAYWVCPLIEETEADADGAPTPTARASAAQSAMAELRNVVETHAQLEAALPGCRIGLLHGRLRSAEKAEVMARFQSGDIQVLVATTVVEVGVDVANASLIVIEHAERFGLAQLHQLRGRVGRGEAASACVLLYTQPLSATARDRLRALVDTNDGFEIARRDLDIRGPGEFMGARQSGDALLRFADLAADGPLLAQARAAAEPLLAQHPAAAEAHMQRWLAGKTDYLKA